MALRHAMRKALLLVLLAAPSLTASQQLPDDEALREAARQGELARIEELLDQGVAVDEPTRYGATALFYAADRGHFAIVRLLVERGANVNVRDTFYGATVIGRTVAGDHLDIAQYLLEQGAEDADSALVAAARRVHLPLLESAIETGQVHAEALESAIAAAQHRGSEGFVARLRQVVPAETLTPRFDQAALHRFVGTYENDFLRQRVDVDIVGDVLTAQIAEGPTLRLTAVARADGAHRQRPLDVYPGIPRTASSFVDGSGNVELSFTGRGGMVEALVLKRDDATTSFRPIGESESREAAPVGDADIIRADARAPTPKGTPRPWPAFRGSNASGIADGQGAPVAWNPSTGENIAWKTPIPGFANSAPIIWGDWVFVTSAISSAGDTTFRIGQYGDTRPVEDLSVHSWRLYSLNRRTGEIRWERLVYEGVPETKRHQKASQANSTPATDGRHVVAVFGAIGRVVCYDVDGNLLWEVNVGALHSGWFYDPDFQWGHSSSPIIYDDLVIVQADTPYDSFLLALDVETGAEVWRSARDEEISTFATPTIYVGSSGDELITNGTTIRAYDPATGELLWFLGPNSEIPIAAPVVSDGLIYLTAGYPPIRPIYVVQPGHRGDLSLPDGSDTSDAVVWSRDRGGTYIPTPLAYRGYFYTNANNGRLTCYDAKTGEIVYRRRIGGVGASYSASPIAADGRLYFSSEDGDIYVVRAGPDYELLAKNEMGEIIMANPAVSDGVLVVRTLNHVYGISE